MKITKSDYKALQDAISRIAPKDIIALDNASTNATQFRWSVFHWINRPPFPFRYLYDYLNDSHIDTALRCILKEG